MAEKIIRVFPRRTNMTPDDELAFTTGPPLYDLERYPVHVSVTFTWDKPRAEALAKQWRCQGFDVKIGGPAYDDPALNFTPGMYIKPGNIFTSRGCNNTCSFCQAWRREGRLRELQICKGYNIMDNNLLNCSDFHVNRVFIMLDLQKRAAEFTGGFEAARLTKFHVRLLANLRLKPKKLFFAYDCKADLNPLVRAAKKMKSIGFNHQRVNCFVLVGRGDDTIEYAKERFQRVVDLDMMPFMMLWADKKPNTNPVWKDLQHIYTRPANTRRAHKGQFGQALRGKVCR